MGQGRRVGRRIAAVVCFALAVVGCGVFPRGVDRPVPLPPNVNPEQVIDADNPIESVTPLRPDELAEAGDLIRADRQKRQEEKRRADEVAGRKPVQRKKYNILALSGGAVYGAYSAGVLVGWSQSGLPPDAGGRPEFDVVTGISTGALIAPFAFLGPEYDEVIRREYTSVRNEDLFTRRRSLRNILSQSLVDNTPFRQRIERAANPCVLAAIAAEHDKGRRLYIGTTNLDTKRIVLWDVGAIAKRGTPEAYKLIHDVIVASASIPAFFPPVKINVTIDGVPYEELHVDGSVTRSLFFRPPHFTPEERQRVDPDTLADSNLYVLVAGKIDPAPAAVRVRTLPLALDSTSILLYSITRGDLYRMYNYCLLTGMNLRVAVIPSDQEVPAKSTEFVPEEMQKLFDAGFELGRRGSVPKQVLKGKGKEGTPEYEETWEGTAWRDVPPGLKAGEKQGARSGTRLTVRPKANETQTETRGPEAPKQPGPAVPPIK